MAKQDRMWRAVAAAMAAADQVGARRALAPLVTPVTAPAVALAERLCRSRRADERAVGVLLVGELLAADPDLPDATSLHAARDAVADRGAGAGGSRR